MPVYEYMCKKCGPFTRMRMMSEYECPSDCPACGSRAPRVMLTAPRCQNMSADARLVHAVNERSAHEPRRLSSSTGGHGTGCACCATPSSSRTRRGKGGLKGFPASRPWMISH